MARVPMIPQPRGEGWRRLPATMTGGAPAFWYRRNPRTGRNEWVSYDRIMRGWYWLREGRTPREDTRTPYDPTREDGPMPR